LIKIGNSPPERPQSGLAQADVVVEHLTEGAITRFSAVYYCSDAADIGPIRSARLIDLELVPMFNAIFAHVGGSEPVRQMIAASEVEQSDLDDYGRAPIFREVAGRKRPFNRYTSTKDLWDLARTQGWIPGSGVQSFNFSAATPAGGRAVNSFTIPYRANLSDVTYTYNASVGGYLRGFGTAPHFDATTGKQLVATNVIILWATHTTTDIIEDSLNSHSIQITTTGSGKAQIFRDGQAFDATWTRGDTHSIFQFTNASGQSLALKLGTTWFEVVPPEMQVK
jgi:hypothetical protein